MNLLTSLAIAAAVLAATVTCGAADAPAGPAKPSTEAVTVAGAANAFAGDLYGQLKAEKGNLFFSPYSISSALTMTSRGAKGATADEMAKVLHFPENAAGLDTGYRELTGVLQASREQKGYQLSVANALWGQRDEAFVPAFTELLKKDYGAGLEAMDFKTDPEGSRKTINTWVEKQTQDRIKDLLPQGTITNLTRLVLTNAIYFKGDWQAKFDKAATKDGDFFISADKKAAVPMMHQKGRFAYAETDAWQALEMPYQGRELAMLVILPKFKDGWGGPPQGVDAIPFSADFVKTVRAQLRPQQVLVTLPRWKATQQFTLNDSLKQLGMKRAFIEGQAEFAGVNGGSDLYITAVVHKAFVEVNEEGTEAAAASGVIMATRAVAVDQPKAFTADHPFLYMIIHQPTGAALFLGRLNDPTP